LGTAAVEVSEEEALLLRGEVSGITMAMPSFSAERKALGPAF